MCDRKICFLILHYKDVNLTKRSINSILKLNHSESFQIVVVENGSNNGSGILLYNMYKDSNYVDVIISEKNLGFSAGNNLGFKYIKEKYMIDFLIIINNDIVIEQRDFIDKMITIYDETPFYVAGPDVYIPQRDYHQSPMKITMRHPQDVYNRIKHYEHYIQEYRKVFSWLSFIYYIRDHYYDKVILRGLYKIKRILTGNSRIYRNEKEENVLLYGCCLLFDKRYCNSQEDIFSPETFLYFEEDILLWKCIKNRWKEYYLPELQVLHLGMGSSQFNRINYNQYKEKRITMYEYLISSLRIYLHYIEKGN